MYLMKKTQIKLIVLFLTYLTLSSCSSGPNSLKTIPNRTDMVGVIDIMSLYEKGKLSELTEMKLFNKGKKEIRSENRKLSRILDNVMEDPKSMGIDLRKDVFIFYINEAKDEQFMGISIDLFSRDNFTEFIDDVLSKIDAKFDIEEERNYSYTIVDKAFGIGWDDEKALFLIPTGYRSGKNLDIEIEDLFTLKEREQITSEANFTDFYSNKKDLNFWFSSNFLENINDFKQIQRELDFDITDMYIAAHLNFEEDAISLKTHLTPNKEVKKLLQQNKIWDTDFNTALLNYFPKQYFAVAGASLNPEAYYNFIKDEEAFIKIEEEIKDETGIDIQDLIESLNGSAVFSFSDVKEFEYTYEKRVYNEYDYSYKYEETIASKNLPVMGFAIDLKDNNELKKLIAEIPDEELTKHKHYYEMKIERRYPIYFAFDDSSLYITNDIKGIKSFKDGEYDGETLRETAVKSALKSNSLYGFMYLDLDKYPKKMRKDMTNYYSAKEKKLQNVWNDFAESISYKQTDDMTYEIVFKTKETGDNSLYTIIKTIDENSKTISSL